MDIQSEAWTFRNSVISVPTVWPWGNTHTHTHTPNIKMKKQMALREVHDLSSCLPCTTYMGLLRQLCFKFHRKWKLIKLSFPRKNGLSWGWGWGWGLVGGVLA